MSEKQYAGIDYGLGQSNIDKETGIRFGAIGQNARHLNQEAVQEIWTHGENLSFESYREDIKGKLSNVFADFSESEEMAEAAFEAVEDEINDNYNSGDTDRYRYDKDGYFIQTSEPNDLVVLRSPFYTHAQFCSPCFPGGGHLENPCPDGPKTYCLGHDWFEENKAPYPVYEVATGKLVEPCTKQPNK